MTTSCALAQVPVQALDDPVTSVLFEVGDCKGARHFSHLLGIAAVQKTTKESLLGPVGPRTAADGAHEKGTGE